MFATIIRIIVTASKYGVGNLLINWSVADVIRLLRNSFLTTINGYSFLLPLLLIILFIYWFRKKNWPLLIFFLSFLIPFIFTNKFWYGGLYGRYGSLIAYGLALMIGLIPNKKIYWLTIFSIFITFVPTFIAYQKKPVPLIQQQLIKQTAITENDLIILSDYQRPQLTLTNGLYINGNNKLTKKIEQEINQVLQKHHRVFITQQAIYFPYWQYDGQQIHIISKGDKNKAVLKIFLKNKKLIKIIEKKTIPFCRFIRSNNFSLGNGQWLIR